MFHKFTSRLDITGTLETMTALHVGAGRATSPVSSDLPVVRDAVGQPYIPGSSFKGVLRSYIESVLRGFTSDKHIVCNPTDEDEQCFTRDDMRELREQRTENDWGDEKFTNEILDKTCWVCKLFGSSWYASKVQIRDLYVPEGVWFGQFQQREGVAIDRDTETSADGMLYDYEVVPAGVQFDFRAIVDNAEPWQLGMLYVGLNAFEKERLTLGGGTSRGLGLVRLELGPSKYLDISRLAEFLTDPSYAGETVAPKDWLKAFGDKIRKKFSPSRQTGGSDAQTDSQ
ncbi:MAG: CRISPR-associated RAMP protein Csx7 [Candidatus Poribacteria bacterium]|nr:CRISPR-associated RAMP protein Csx7 [Candidatus Poribacteria bacterium]